MFRFNDPLLARKFAMNGLTLWLDEDKEFGVHYQDYALTHMLLNSDPRQLMRGQISREAFIPKGSFALINEDKTWETEHLAAFSLNAEFEQVNGLYCFEFSIPLTAQEDKINLSAEKIIPVGIELSAVSEEVQKALKEKREQGMQGRSGGRGKSGMNGGMGGGMGGRGGGQRAGRRPLEQQMDFDGKEIWLDVVLAK